jgi:hypothetical protein
MAGNLRRGGPYHGLVQVTGEDWSNQRRVAASNTAALATRQGIFLNPRCQVQEPEREVQCMPGRPPHAATAGPT